MKGSRLDGVKVCLVVVLSFVECLQYDTKVSTDAATFQSCRGPCHSHRLGKRRALSSGLCRRGGFKRFGDNGIVMSHENIYTSV
ncbi:hypothetical protein DFP72DRAFT_868139 [Ephemerocybe angulata]|uniref:Secreted protein n=1 Tax=Ephemerocybe angulata TaxID=980116 RepID=A0A8H6IJU6_9AGAR|nr:hypothetical protein DFP72DRAFT_868139 [Tulosesus angulatus]